MHLARPSGRNQKRSVGRQTAAVSRKLRLLRAHRLIRNVPRTRRYHLTQAGRDVVTALIAARTADTQQLVKMPAWRSFAIREH